MVAFVWRLALTTGTGSIFGFLVARQGYDAAIMAPMFIIMSFAYGLALYLLVLMFTFNADDRPLGDAAYAPHEESARCFRGSGLLFHAGLPSDQSVRH